jgi:hypothetical protein
VIYWLILLNKSFMTVGLYKSVHWLNYKHGLGDDRIICSYLTPIGAST